MRKLNKPTEKDDRWAVGWLVAAALPRGEGGGTGEHVCVWACGVGGDSATGWAHASVAGPRGAFGGGGGTPPEAVAGEPERPRRVGGRR